MTPCEHEWQNRGPSYLFGQARPVPARYCPKCKTEVACEGGFDEKDRPIPTSTAQWVATRCVMTLAEFREDLAFKRAT